jgi:hypothetical protein
MALRGAETGTGRPAFSPPYTSQMELLCALVLGWPDHVPPKASRQLEGRIIHLEK